MAATVQTGLPSDPDAATVVTGSTASVPRGRAIEPGDTLGRYVVEHELGRGGMGHVFAAHDPDLDREVAVKVLRDDRRTPEGRAAAREQLLAEGKAMAKLSHAHVVPVYDVGVSEHGVFVAMELVQGRTASVWLRSEERSAAEILEVYVQAGRGLAAIHAAGLVHRDFKPANVMVGDDGRVQVMDFGLALLGRGGFDSLTASRDSMHESRSATGIVMGTPGYMPPEALHGEPTDARGDQFSFCVALYRALYRVPPYPGSNNADLDRAMRAGALAAPAPDASAPLRYRSVLARGLAADSDARYPSMEALLDALERRAGPPRRAAWVGGAALLTAGTVATVVLADSSQPCDSGEARLAGIWEGDARGAVEQAFVALDTPLARDTWSRVVPELDGYAAELATGYDQACADARRDGDGRALDLRVACLDARVAELEALAAVLAMADTDAVERATSAVAHLPDVADCEDVDALAAAHRAPPPEHAEEVAAIEEQLRRAGVLHRAGKYAAAASEAGQAVDRARAVGYEPVLARALVRLGDALERSSEFEESVTLTEEAFWLASAADLDEVAFSAATDLVYLLGLQLARTDEAMTWQRHAESLLDRVGRDGPDEARLLSNVASALSAPDPAAARESYRRSLAIYETAGPSYRADVAMLHNNYASMVDEAGDMNAALEHYRKSIEIYEETKGPHHPDLGMPLLGISAVHHRQGRPEEALETVERARDLFAASAPEGSGVAGAELSRSNILRQLGRDEDSRKALEHAKEIFVRIHGTDHPYVSAVANNLGQAYKDAGRLDDAIAEYREAIRVLEPLVGSEHPRIAGALSNIGSALMAKEQPREALDYYQRSLAMFAATAEGDVLDMHYPLVGIAQAHVALDEPAQAIAPLERALALLTEQNAEPKNIEYARALLAQAREAAG